MCLLYILTILRYVKKKKKLLELNLPKEIKTEKNVKINDVDLIANEFNDFFLSVG